LQTTLERQPDFLRLVQQADGGTYILHIEFQSNDQAAMIYRMAEYKAILLRKFQLPVDQYVIFLGSETSKMKTHLTKDQIISGFQLKNFTDFKYQNFLSAREPEIVIMALLCDLQGSDPEQIINKF